MNTIVTNYGLHRLNGWPTRNLEGTSAQIVTDSSRRQPSVPIGRLRLKIYGNKSVKSAKSVVKKRNPEILKFEILKL
jgi:hypothetical protein